MYHSAKPWLCFEFCFVTVGFDSKIKAKEPYSSLILLAFFQQERERLLNLLKIQKEGRSFVLGTLWYELARQRWPLSADQSFCPRRGAQHVKSTSPLVLLPLCSSYCSPWYINQSILSFVTAGASLFIVGRLSQWKV